MRVANHPYFHASSIADDSKHVIEQARVDADAKRAAFCFGHNPQRSAVSLEIARLEKQARERLADFQNVLASEPRATNDFLSKILEGPLRFKADSGYFRIEGEVSKSKALFGAKVCVPRGIR